MKLKLWQNIFRVIANANSILQHVTEIKNGITIHGNARVKTIACDKNFAVVILAHVFVRIVGKYCWCFSLCDEIIMSHVNKFWR